MGGNNSKTKPVLDLEELLKPWAWNVFLKTTPETKIEFSDVTLDVTWDKVHFNTSFPAFGSKQGPVTSGYQLVFQCVYENNTTEFQEQNLATSRTTVAKATTALFKGFTRGVNTDIKMPIPEEVTSATSGFGNEVTIKTDETNTVSQDFSWQTNSSIKLPPKSKIFAKITVDTQQFQCDFSSFVTFKGIVIIRILDNRTGDVIRVVQNDIATIVRDELIKKKVKFNVPNPDAITISGRTVQWPIAGELRFQYGVTQHVELDPL